MSKYYATRSFKRGSHSKGYAHIPTPLSRTPMCDYIYMNKNRVEYATSGAAAFFPLLLTPTHIY